MSLHKWTMVTGGRTKMVLSGQNAYQLFNNSALCKACRQITGPAERKSIGQWFRKLWSGESLQRCNHWIVRTGWSQCSFSLSFHWLFTCMIRFSNHVSHFKLLALLMEDSYQTWQKIYISYFSLFVFFSKFICTFFHNAHFIYFGGHNFI